MMRKSILALSLLLACAATTWAGPILKGKVLKKETARVLVEVPSERGTRSFWIPKKVTVEGGDFSDLKRNTRIMIYLEPRKGRFLVEKVVIVSRRR
jgi:hypothetical protein